MSSQSLARPCNFDEFSSTNRRVVQYTPDPVRLSDSLDVLDYNTYLYQVIEDQDQDASKLQELASSILSECKQSRPVSTLETAILLLRQVLDQLPPSHPLRPDALHHLSSALLTRFNQWGWIEDSDEAVKLITELSAIAPQTSDMLSEAQVC
jgi:hypothetical protein